MTDWIWEQQDWPNFYWQEDAIALLLRTVRLHQGILLGKIGSINEDASKATMLNASLENIMTSSAIEGEILDVRAVRSSLMKRLGLKPERSLTTSRSEGLAQLLMDTTRRLSDLRHKNCLEKLSGDGRSTRYRIKK